MLGALAGSTARCPINRVCNEHPANRCQRTISCLSPYFVVPISTFPNSPISPFPDLTKDIVSVPFATAGGLWLVRATCSPGQHLNLPEGGVTFHLHRSRTWILLLQLVNDAGNLKTGVHEKGAETKNNCGRVSFCFTLCPSKDRPKNGAQTVIAITALTQRKTNSSRCRTDQTAFAGPAGQTHRRRFGNANQTGCETTQNAKTCRGRPARRETLADRRTRSTVRSRSGNS